MKEKQETVSAKQDSTQIGKAPPAPAPANLMEGEMEKLRDQLREAVKQQLEEIKGSLRKDLLEEIKVLVEESRSPFKPEIAAREEEAEEMSKEYRKASLAQAITFAILRNPKVDQFCYGSPLDPHVCGDYQNVGAYLANASLRLADQYAEAMDALMKERLEKIKAK